MQTPPVPPTSAAPQAVVFRFSTAVMTGGWGGQPLDGEGRLMHLDGLPIYLSGRSEMALRDRLRAARPGCQAHGDAIVARAAVHLERVHEARPHVPGSEAATFYRMHIDAIDALAWDPARCR